jgi:hypothetical protein
VRRKSAYKVGVKVIYYVRCQAMSASAKALHRMGGAKGAGRVENESFVNRYRCLVEAASLWASAMTHDATFRAHLTHGPRSGFWKNESWPVHLCLR